MVKLDKRWVLLISILALFLLVRLVGINQAVSTDEQWWVELFRWEHWHPPMGVLLHLFIQFLFGNSIYTHRLLLVGLSSVNLILVFIIASKLYGKKSAYYSIAFMSISAYHIMASLQMDLDGVFLTLFYLLCTLFLLLYIKERRFHWLGLMGVSFGCALLTKYTAVFLIPFLGLYYLIVTRDFLKSVKIFTIMVILGLLVFSLFPLYNFAFFNSSISHLLNYTGTRLINIPLLLIQYSLFIVWAGPIIIVLFLLSLKKLSKSDLLPIIWILVVICGYSLISQDNFKPIERYLELTIPAFSMVIGNFLSKIKFNIKHLAVSLGICAVLFLVFFIFNSSGTIISFYPKTAFIDHVLSFKWNFFMPIQGSSGPIGFYLNFAIIALAYILSVVVLLIAFLKDNKPLVMAILIGITLSYNLFVAEEYLLALSSPNIGKISDSVVAYANTHDLKQPVYAFRNTAYHYYLTNKYSDIRIINFDIENDQKQIAEMMNSSPTVLVVDFPSINKESLFFKSLAACRILYTTEDKGYMLGYVYDCSR